MDRRHLEPRPRCTKTSPGRAHCYAETFAEHFRGVPGHPYEQGFDLRLVPEKLAEPLKWRSPRMVFVNSMSDLFHEDVPDDTSSRSSGLCRWRTGTLMSGTPPSANLELSSIDVAVCDGSR